VKAKARKKEKLVSFDVAAFLDSPESIAEYLTQVPADGEPDELLRALGHIAKARGMAQIAADAGMGRESLYKALASGAHPRYDTVLKVTRSLECGSWRSRLLESSGARSVCMGWFAHKTVSGRPTSS